ncbi:SWIB domain-containing protein [Cryptosporidium canis]|uniref:SWIB domain-containing protein n=1 Tax=Cryptosporidium canis TaxID=195482 RepID=A0ABQ8P801_9CRYT|nr:SWIB domain-containing protein [Cryptosporidium canis]KAJ1614410.1 SWIB domain-containing protein [Cryptosporidium canis]
MYNQVSEEICTSSPSCLNLDERIGESKIVKKVKVKEKIYTIKTIIDRQIGTDWVNSKISSNIIPSQNDIESQIAVILSNCNLNTITLRKLYALLSTCFNVNLLNTDIHNIFQIIRENISKVNKSNENDMKKKKFVTRKKHN